MGKSGGGVVDNLNSNHIPAITKPQHQSLTLTKYRFCIKKINHIFGTKIWPFK
jgi:hypothetical protein